MTPKRIFLLEDEIHITPRNVMKDILAGHTVTIATSKDEAIAKYPGGQPYDLLLLDHDMRGIWGDFSCPNTGFAFIQWLITHPKVGESDEPDVMLHSQCGPARTKMKGFLVEHGFKVKDIPFGPEYLDWLRKV